MTQKDYLNAAKKKLGITWDELAKKSNIHPRALKTYRMPYESKDYRAMPPLAKDAIERLLNELQ
ncbi:hypothetical protein [Vibrio cholerae]|uniref:Transcriptional regulator n=1 Tax=Vibrio cholerae TaxID=666 RepID=A0A7Z7VNH3_VIBCL|nr:hypothetical protein [Vibrio cholerae]TBM41326.1 hypothetical protein EYB64_12185 [Vibrio cholerae]